MGTSSGQARQLTLLLALMLLALVSCHAAGSPAAGSPEELLDELTVVDQPAADPTYRRAAFGRAWADVDGDGCNTRDQVLYATLDQDRPYRVRRQGRCPTDMVAGTWTDLYTQQQMTWTDLKDPTQAEELPLDHIVSLAAAWRYGARGWSSEQRLRFANDPLELTATTADVNSSKSDHDPGAWTPPSPGRCGYARRYIAVKTKYQLPVDRYEKAALQQLLGSCPR